MLKDTDSQNAFHHRLENSMLNMKKSGHDILICFFKRRLNIKKNLPWWRSPS